MLMKNRKLTLRILKKKMLAILVYKSLYSTAIG